MKNYLYQTIQALNVIILDIDRRLDALEKLDIDRRLDALEKGEKQ